MDGFGDDIQLYIDTDHTTGGVWGTANYAALGAADTIDRNPGVQSAEFPDRAAKRIGHRRSRIRNMQLDVQAYILPGDPAYDRLIAAARNSNNDGSEIVRVMYVEGERTEPGNFFWEGDVVVTDPGTPSSGFGEGSTRTIVLRSAADSPNTPIEGTTS